MKEKGCSKKKNNKQKFLKLTVVYIKMPHKQYTRITMCICKTNLSFAWPLITRIYVSLLLLTSKFSQLSASNNTNFISV